MKAILVIDVGADVDFEKDFAKIRLFTSNGRGISYYNKVKLQPMPQELPTPYMMRQIQIAEGIQTEKPPYTEDYQKGWNDCLEEILGDYE